MENLPYLDPCSSAETAAQCAVPDSDTNETYRQSLSARDEPKHVWASQVGMAQHMQKQNRRGSPHEHVSALQQEPPTAVGTVGTETDPQAGIKLGASESCQQHEFSFRHLHELIRSGVQQSGALVQVTKQDGPFCFQPQEQPPVPRTNLTRQPISMNLPPVSASQPHKTVQVLEQFTGSEQKPKLGEQLQSGATGRWLQPAAPLEAQVTTGGTNTHSSFEDAGSSASKLHVGELRQSQNNVFSLPQHSGKVELQANCQNEAHGCCLPLSTAHPPATQAGFQAEHANPAGKVAPMGKSPVLSALDAYNKAKKFGPRTYHSSPSSLSPCCMPPVPDRRKSHAVEAQQFARPRSLSPSYIRRPPDRAGSLLQPMSTNKDIHTHSLARDKMRPPVGHHPKNWQKPKLCKENDSRRARRHSKEARQSYSSSESPVSTRGLDVWRCNALETALQQVEKTLSATSRARSNKAKRAMIGAAAKGMGEGAQSSKGTMSNILERMRQGSAQRQLRKKQQGDCDPQNLSKRRSNEAQKRFPSQERGVSNAGTRWATGQRCLQRSSSAVERRGKGAVYSRPGSACNEKDKASSKRHARVRCAAFVLVEESNCEIHSKLCGMRNRVRNPETLGLSQRLFRGV